MIITIVHDYIWQKCMWYKIMGETKIEKGKIFVCLTTFLSLLLLIALDRVAEKKEWWLGD